VRSFNEWKTVTISKLIELKRKYANEPKKRDLLSMVLMKVHYAKKRDLGTLLYYMDLASQEIPEMTELIPSSEEISKWLRGEKED